MNDVNDILTRSSSGENRLKPDEQRKYLGTYKERVIYSISTEDCRHHVLQSNFSNLLSTIDENINVTIKISSQLPTDEQVQFMKTAKEAKIRSTIVDEEKQSSPFGIVIHTDHPVNKDITDVKKLFPNYFSEEKETINEKKSFFSKLFRK